MGLRETIMAMLAKKGLGTGGRPRGEHPATPIQDYLQPTIGKGVTEGRMVNPQRQTMFMPPAGRVGNALQAPSVYGDELETGQMPFGAADGPLGVMGAPPQQQPGYRNPDGSVKGFGGLRQLSDRLDEFESGVAESGYNAGKALRSKIMGLRAAIERELGKRPKAQPKSNIPNY